MMYANQHSELREYMIGDYRKEMSVGVFRFEHLRELNWMSDNTLILSFRDTETNMWTKWQGFHSNWSQEQFLTAIDIHRSMLSNEIIVESDYPTYEENYEATKIIGRIIEGKGFTPHYYFSGNKSIHAHIFIDFKMFEEVNKELWNRIKETFRFAKIFIRKFMTWLREKFISCWDMNVREFDRDLINPKHLIRCEMSRNKQGFKTYLGSSYKDLSFVPYVCNEENHLYPRIGPITLSKPNNPDELLLEFLNETDKAIRKKKVANREFSLSYWTTAESQKELRDCVKHIFSDEFKEVGDGYQRAMFILANELKKFHLPDKVLIMLRDWNARMGGGIRDHELVYRSKTREYKLTCPFIHNFLDTLGINISEKCNGKLFK